MLIIPPVKLRKNRRPLHQEQTSEPTPPPVALTLTAADYTYPDLSVTLVFDRAVNIDAFDPASVVVRDGSSRQAIMPAGSASLVDAVTVLVTLTVGDYYNVDETVLNATAASGIVAVDDGGTWDGATDLGLPYGG